LQSYNGRDVIITLPGAVTAFDVNYLAIYSEDDGLDVGSVVFNVTRLENERNLG